MMAVKNITKKSEIPLYAQKRIKNFKNLTKNQAIYEYEMLKLKRRIKDREYASFLSGWFTKPAKITKKFIEEIKSFKGKKLTYEKEKYETERRIREQEIKQRFEDENWDVTLYEEPEPEPSFIDYNTGEVFYDDDVSNILDRGREFIDELIQYTTQESALAEVDRSHYASGKSRSQKGIAFIKQNLDKSAQKIITRLEQIKNDNDSLIAFTKKAADPSWLGALQSAITEYLLDSDSAFSTTNDIGFQSSAVYNLLSDIPMSLDDSMDFEYEE